MTFSSLVYMLNTALEKTFITLCCFGKSSALFSFSIIIPLCASVSRNAETLLADQRVYLTCFQIDFFLIENEHKLKENRIQVTAPTCSY